MIELTTLEREVLGAIVLSIVKDEGAVSVVLQSLVVSDRSFSTDVIDKSRCIGFFLEFKPNELLTGVPDIPHHLGVQASHSTVPPGGDFILFCDQAKAGIKVLEGSFFGHLVPIHDLMSKDHGFSIKDIR
jgi:hypothetical protein